MTVLIDCTLRDGGYYTNWDFPAEAVTSYLEAMKEIDVDYVEIGFASLAHSRNSLAHMLTARTSFWIHCRFRMA